MIRSILSHTDNYTQTLTLRPIAALPDHFELVIKSQLATAKNPSKLQVLHRAILTEQALLELHSTIGKCLRLASISKKLETRNPKQVGASIPM